MSAQSQHCPGEIAILHSRWLGSLKVDADCALAFPVGLPGFEELRMLIPVEIPAHRPIVYLQSPDDAEMCFVALPVYVIEPDFRLQLSDEDRAMLQLPENCEPVIGDDVLCLALLRRSGLAAEANPDAAIVINLHNRIGIQCVPPADAPQRFRRLGVLGWAAPC